MKISEVIKLTDEICPPELAEEWDNCGWQVNCGDREVREVMTALEITSAVIEEASSKGANLIITHHPMIFQGIKAIDINTVTGKYIFKLLEKGISVYSCHTDFDKTQGGNNDYLGEALGLSEIRVLEDGFTRTGELREEMKASDFARMVCERLNISPRAVRVCGDLDRIVRKAGWCTGAGAEFAKEAAASGCDAFITGDVKYHEARDAAEEGKIVVIDAGHFGTEVSFGENMAKLLSDKAGGKVKVTASKAIADPYGHLL